jgi:hypothetical protein
VSGTRKKALAIAAAACLLIVAVVGVLQRHRVWLAILETRSAGGTKAEKLQSLGACYNRVPVGVDRAFDAFGLPDEAVAFAGEVPTPGVHVTELPATRGEFEAWFGRQSEEYVRVSLVWRTDAGDYALEFREGKTAPRL